MDLTHLFKSSRYIQTESRTQQHRDDSAGSDREVMFKKKGFNFYSSTSDSRIIRSSQVFHFPQKSFLGFFDINCQALSNSCLFIVSVYQDFNLVLADSTYIFTFNPYALCIHPY